MPPEHVSPGDTALLSAVSPTATVDRLVSVVVMSSEGVVSVHRAGAPIVVGRDTACDLVLADDATSRRHARLTPHATGIEVTDLDSRNGTFVNGHPVRRAAAQPGGLIRIGSFLLLVVQLDEVWQPAELVGPLVGGAAIAPVRRTVSLVGPTELPVIISGETGTGKEVVARLLH
jgi:pSer/pThr/pTyr-binding forkhead associated (FHA) protein